MFSSNVIIEVGLTNYFRTKDGFCWTGDLGHYDEHGILYFNGRNKDLIKHNGHHLYPKEMETIIQKHPCVAEVVVFGTPEPKYMVMFKFKPSRGG